LKTCASTISGELPIIMVTAKHRATTLLKRWIRGQRLFDEADRFSRRGGSIGTQLSHKQAQEALKESEARYALAARGSNDGLWELESFGQRCAFLPSLEGRCWAMRKEKWGTDLKNGLTGSMTRTENESKREIAAHQKGLTPHFESEHRVLHKEGSFRWMLSRGSPSMTLPEMFCAWPGHRPT